jgi:hypothetical protein
VINFTVVESDSGAEPKATWAALLSNSAREESAPKPSFGDLWDTLQTRPEGGSGMNPARPEGPEDTVGLGHSEGLASWWPSSQRIFSSPSIGGPARMGWAHRPARSPASRQSSTSTDGSAALPIFVVDPNRIVSGPRI